jgi:death-on-curing protein
MGGKFAVINEGNLCYCIESVVEIGNHPSLFDSCAHKSAYYICCLSEGHGLLDSNKRTAFQVADVFLRANGFKIRVQNTDHVVEMFTHVSMEHSAIENIRQWISQHIIPIST